MNKLKKRNNKKGFTLAELLIVVAIIAVLVAVSIPIFTAQLKKARLATNQANARAAYAGALAEQLTDDEADAKYRTYVYDADTGKVGAPTSSDTDNSSSATIKSSDISNWTYESPAPTGKISVEALGNTVYKKWTVYVDTDNKVTGYSYSN